MNKFTDTHAHVTQRSFEDKLDEVITELVATNTYAYNIGTTIEDSKEIVELSKKNKNLIPVVGVHPCDTQNWNESMINELEEILQNEKGIAAIGEIGLDYYHEPFNIEEQKKAFIDQIELANKYKMPIVVHTRESLNDCYDIIKNYKETKFLLHSWSGDVEMTKKFLGISDNIYFSYNGILTFKNAQLQQKTIPSIPLNRLMFETDCPWLSPVPHRGKKNFPWRVQHTIEFAAELLNIEYNELNNINNKNAKDFYLQ